MLHPGSWKGLTREEGLWCWRRGGLSGRWTGLDLKAGGLRVLIENTAGAEFSLGGSFEQVAELVERLRECVPVGVCLDTCHCHVKGYDLVSEEGWAETTKLIESTMGFDAVKVWHCNDAKAAMGSSKAGPA